MLVKVKDKCQDCGKSFLRVFMSYRGLCVTCEGYAVEAQDMTATPPPRLILDKIRSIESLDLSSLEVQRAGLRVAPKSASDVEMDVAGAIQQAKIDLEKQAAATLGLNPDVFEKYKKTVLPREEFKEPPIPSLEQPRELLFKGAPLFIEPPTKPTSKPASRLAGPRKKRRFNFDEA